MDDRHPSGTAYSPAPASDADYASFGAYEQQSAQYGGYSGYDGYDYGGYAQGGTATATATGSTSGGFDTDPLFGDLPGSAPAQDTGAYGTGHWAGAAGAGQGAQYDAYSAYQPTDYAGYGTDGYAAEPAGHYDTGGHDVGGWSAGQQLGGIPSQHGHDTSGQWDATAWNGPQWDDHGVDPYGTAPYEPHDLAGQGQSSGHGPSHGYEAPGAQQGYGAQPFDVHTAETQTFDAQAFATQTFDASAFETQTFDGHTLETQTFEPGQFADQNFATQVFDAQTGAPGTFDAPGYDAHVYAEHTAEGPDAAHGVREHDYSYDPADGEELIDGTGPADWDESRELDEDPGSDYADALEYEELPEYSPESGPAPGGRARQRTARNASRARRRTPAKRSALFTVAVPSVCVMGVAGIAAASVDGLSGDDTKDTAATVTDPATVKPAAANNKLDTQLEHLSADAGDFADRASRTQERIDLKAKQEAARKKAAEEAARKEALRPKFLLPVTQKGLSAYFGQAGVNWMSVHTGIDFPVSYGTKVMSAIDGTLRTQWNSAYGNMAIVTAKDGTETWYCHLSRYALPSGSAVKAGDQIAFSGNSGNSTGPHLHFEVRPGGGAAIDPLPWLRSHDLDPT